MIEPGGARQRDGDAPVTGHTERHDHLDAALGLLLADERAADAVRSRILERNLRVAASADATLTGVLVDLAERGDAIALRTVGGRTVRGRIVLVALDAIVVDTSLGTTSYVALSGLAWIRRLGPGVGTPAVSTEPCGDRPGPRASTFARIVSALAPERPRVALAVFGECTALTGELLAAGNDVLTVRLEGNPPNLAYVAMGQLSELTVLASG